MSTFTEFSIKTKWNRLVKTWWAELGRKVLDITLSYFRALDVRSIIVIENLTLRFFCLWMYFWFKTRSTVVVNGTMVCIEFICETIWWNYTAKYTLDSYVWVEWTRERERDRGRESETERSRRRQRERQEEGESYAYYNEYENANSHYGRIGLYAQI